MSQLASLDVERLLADGECVVASRAPLESDDRTRLKFHVASDLVDPEDPHLGYTQIVRMVEAARYLEFDRLRQQANLPALDCTLRAMQMQCLAPLERNATALVTAITGCRTDARTAFTMDVSVRRDERLEPLVEVQMVLVMINDAGESVELPAAFRSAITAPIDV